MITLCYLLIYQNNQYALLKFVISLIVIYFHIRCLSFLFIHLLLPSAHWSQCVHCTFTPPTESLKKAKWLTFNTKLISYSQIMSFVYVFTVLSLMNVKLLSICFRLKGTNEDYTASSSGQCVKVYLTFMYLL